MAGLGHTLPTVCLLLRCVLGVWNVVLVSCVYLPAVSAWRECQLSVFDVFASKGCLRQCGVSFWGSCWVSVGWWRCCSLVPLVRNTAPHLNEGNSCGLDDSTFFSVRRTKNCKVSGLLLSSLLRVLSSTNTLSTASVSELLPQVRIWTRCVACPHSSIHLSWSVRCGSKVFCVCAAGVRTNGRPLDSTTTLFRKQTWHRKVRSRGRPLRKRYFTASQIQRVTSVFFF